MIKNITEKAHHLEWDGYIKFRGCEVNITTDEIIKKAKDFVPEAIDKLSDYLDLLEGRPDLLLDKLGIDFLIEYNGQRYAIDVTTAKRDSIVAKINKMAGRLKFFDSLNAIPVIVRSPNGHLPDKLMDLILESKIKKGVLDCRLDNDLCLIV